MNFIKYIKEPWRIVVAFDRHIASIVPDKLFLQCIFRCLLGYKLNLNNPITYCEKLQYLKLYDKNNIYSTLTDKFEVRKYISDFIGDEYLIPLLGNWTNANDINYNLLPSKFVLKCSHDSGSVVICKNKDKLDKISVNIKLNKALKFKFWKNGREMAYVRGGEKKPRIICEKYIYDDDDIAKQPDYKFFCFNGKVKYFQQNIGRTSSEGVKVCFYDENKHYVDIQEAANYKSEKQEIISNKIDEMIKLAELLSKDMPHVRIDFLIYNDRIYFSEFTFYHCAGFYPFYPKKWNNIFGDLIDLSLVNKG